MPKPFKGVINVEITDSVPDWEPYTQPTAPEAAGGVLFAHGSRFGGHALYIKDRKLKYVYNFAGLVRAGHRVDHPSRRPDTWCSPRCSTEDGDSMPVRRDADVAHPSRQGGRRPDQDPAGQVLDRWRRAECRQGRRRARHRRLSGRLPLALRRRHHPPGRRSTSAATPFVDLAREAAAAFARD